MDSDSKTYYCCTKCGSERFKVIRTRREGWATTRELICLDCDTLHKSEERIVQVKRRGEWQSAAK